MLADLDPRHIGRDRLKITPNLRWSVWLWIECFEVSRSTIHPNENAIARLLLRGGAATGLFRIRFSQREKIQKAATRESGKSKL